MDVKIVFLFLAVFIASTYSKKRPNAVVKLTSGISNIKGSVKFVKLEDGSSEVQGKFQGLQPGETYGVHIHEGTDISNNCAAVGHHFDPRGEPHGMHLGDIAVITADSNGHARFIAEFKDIEYDGPNSIIGRALGISVEDEDFDDDAEEVLGCGTITLFDGKKKPGHHHHKHHHHPPRH